MASFVEDLWQSIFTPGPTSTLVIATNVTFAALQLVLLALLIATFSIHFIILSILCAGLWASINWFAKEVQIAQATLDKAKQDKTRSDGDALESTDDTRTLGDEQEAISNSTSQSASEHRNLRGAASGSSGEPRRVEPVAVSSGSTNTRGPSGTLDSLKLRSGKSLAGSTGDLSASGTDSEWEKVEGDR